MPAPWELLGKDGDVKWFTVEIRIDFKEKHRVDPPRTHLSSLYTTPQQTDFHVTQREFLALSRLIDEWVQSRADLDEPEA